MLWFTHISLFHWEEGDGEDKRRCDVKRVSQIKEYQLYEAGLDFIFKDYFYNEFSHALMTHWSVVSVTLRPLAWWPAALPVCCLCCSCWKLYQLKSAGRHDSRKTFFSDVGETVWPLVLSSQTSKGASRMPVNSLQVRDLPTQVYCITLLY